MQTDQNIMRSVKSSNIAAIGYDAETQTMLVTFKGSGATYAYDSVPADVHEKLMAADSVGKHFSTHIRAKYSSARVPAEQTKAEPENVLAAG